MENIKRVGMGMLTSLSLLISLEGCGPKYTPAYDVGPIGPFDPIFDKYNPVKIKKGTLEVASSIPKSNGTQEPGIVASYPGAAIGRALIPPRRVIRNQPPAETFGSAIGRTEATENRGSSAQPRPQARSGE